MPLANFNRPGAQPSPPRAPAPARTARCTSRATVTLRHYTTQRDRPRWQASLARWLLAHHCALADARAQGSCQHDRDPADFQTTKGERFADRTRRFVRALPCRVARLACSHCTDSLPCCTCRRSEPVVSASACAIKSARYSSGCCAHPEYLGAFRSWPGFAVVSASTCANHPTRRCTPE